MAIDLNRCVGCQACATACKIANNLPKAITYNTVYTKTDTDPDTFGTAVVHGAIANDSAGGEWPNCTLSFLPVQCQHCDNPSCLAVCPTGATKKREDGIVWVDNSLCIGCRACIMACPYDNVRSFVEGEPEYYLDVVVGEAGVGAGPDHVVHQQLHGAVRSQVGAHGMALGHECSPALAGGDVALALEVHVGAVHRVVADVQVHGQRAHRGQAVARNVGARAYEIGDAVLHLYPYGQAAAVIYFERLKRAHGAFSHGVG